LPRSRKLGRNGRAAPQAAQHAQSATLTTMVSAAVVVFATAESCTLHLGSCIGLNTANCQRTPRGKAFVRHQSGWFRSCIPCPP